MIKIIPTIKYIVVLLALCVLNPSLLIFRPSVASAQETSLKLTPSSLQIQVLPPSTIKAPIIIENLSNQSISLRPLLKEFKASSKADGTIEHLSDKDQFIKKGLSTFDESNIRIFEAEKIVNEITLGPNQKKQLQIEISIPEDSKIRDHYFSVIFLNTAATSNGTQQAQKHTSINLNSGVAMNVILSLISQNSDLDDTPNSPSEADKSSWTVEEFHAPGFVEKGPVPFNIKINNNAINYIKPKGTVTIKNMFGQTIGKIDLQQSTILSNSSRYLISTSKSSESPTVSREDQDSINESSNPKAIWEESFLLGFYEAQLDVEISPSGPVLSATTKFIAFPINLIAGIFTFAIIFLLIRKRVKQKMSQR